MFQCRKLICVIASTLYDHSSSKLQIVYCKMESSRGGGAGGSADATVDESKGKEDLKTAARILESYLSASADSLPKDLIFEGRHSK